MPKKGSNYSQVTPKLNPVSDLDDAKMDAILDRINNLLDEKLSKLESTLAQRIAVIESSQKNEISILKKTIKELETRIGHLEINSRKNNFIIKGVPENVDRVDGIDVSSPEKATASIAKAINVPIVINACFRLGKPREDGSPRPILVKSTETCAFNMIRSARKLKQAGDEGGRLLFNKTFIDKDYPPETAAALAKLRKKAFEHRRTNPGAESFVRNGKLFIDGAVVEEINL